MVLQLDSLFPLSFLSYLSSEASVVEIIGSAGSVSDGESYRSHFEVLRPDQVRPWAMVVLVSVLDPRTPRRPRFPCEGDTGDVQTTFWLTFFRLIIFLIIRSLSFFISFSFSIGLPTTKIW